jgi:cytoskeletal protein CcmA (bactofilin family)
MWKKEERVEDRPNTRAATPQPATASSFAPSAGYTPEPAFGSDERATIGRSITVRGDLTGDEDLVIQGRVEGTVDLQQHAVTVGPDGEVTASIVGRVVTIEGRVEGNIVGSEQVVLRHSAYVRGDITAPRVVLENGARFRGLVDMGEGEELGTARPGGDPRKSTRGATAEETRRTAVSDAGAADAETQANRAEEKGGKPAGVEARLAV